MVELLLESAVRSLGIGVVVWIVLRLARLRNPQGLSLIWTAVLLSALTMPMLMTAMEAAMRSAPAAAVAWIPSASPVMPLLGPLDSQNIAGSSPHIDGSTWMAIVYGSVAGVVLVRLLVGLLRGQRLRRRAVRLSQPWTSGWDIRVSDELSSPATYGHTVLLPTEWSDWDAFKRDAILAHEKFHVRRRDFLVQLLAGVHRAVFWFSPLAWWLQSELLRASENACDDQAIRAVKDRISYAEILIDLVKAGSKQTVVGVAMARGKTVESRIERILQDTKVAPGISVVRRVLIVGVFVPVVGFAAGSWLVKAEAEIPSQGVVLLRAGTPATTQEVRPAGPVVATPPATPTEEPYPVVSTRQEQEAFKDLRTDEEREAFLEQFWLRRDPSPGTRENEFRNEYYRRTLLAIQRFSTPALAGSSTHRGRILIMFGEPDQVEVNPNGGVLLTGGNDSTTTFPLERWRYRMIEGLGQNVIVEFVDAGRNEEYPLRLDGLDASWRERLIGPNR